MTKQEADFLAEVVQDPELLRKAINSQINLLEETRTLPLGPEINRWMTVMAAECWLATLEKDKGRLSTPEAFRSRRLEEVATEAARFVETPINANMIRLQDAVKALPPLDPDSEAADLERRRLRLEEELQELDLQHPVNRKGAAR